MTLANQIVIRRNEMVQRWKQANFVRKWPKSVTEEPQNLGNANEKAQKKISNWKIFLTNNRNEIWSSNMKLKMG